MSNVLDVLKKDLGAPPGFALAQVWASSTVLTLCTEERALAMESESLSCFSLCSLCDILIEDGMRRSFLALQPRDPILLWDLEVSPCLPSSSLEWRLPEGMMPAPWFA